MGGCHMDGHLLLKIGGRLQITRKSGYRLSCFAWESIKLVTSATGSEGWALRHRHSQN